MVEINFSDSLLVGKHCHKNQIAKGPQTFQTNLVFADVLFLSYSCCWLFLEMHDNRYQFALAVSY